MKQLLTDIQIAFLIFGAIVGYGIINLPKDVAEMAGTGGWFPILISTILVLIIAYMITYLNYVHENKTLDEYSKLLTGKYITYIFLGIYIVYFFLIFTFIARISAEVIRLNILIRTPIWALLLLYFGVVYYAVIKGLRGIARLCEFYGLIILPGAFLVNSLISSQGRYIHLRPLFLADDMSNYFTTALVTIIPFLGVEVITFIPIDKKTNKKIFKYTSLIILIIGLLYIFTFEACISVIGVDDIIYYKDSLIATIRRIDILLLEFLSRIDGLVLSLWIMATFCTIAIFAYGTSFYVSRIYKGLKFEVLSFIIILAGYIVAQIPRQFEVVEQIIEYIGYLGLIPLIVIPIILLTLTKVKKYDTTKK